MNLNIIFACLEIILFSKLENEIKTIQLVIRKVNSIYFCGAIIILYKFEIILNNRHSIQ